MRPLLLIAVWVALGAAPAYGAEDRPLVLVLPWKAAALPQESRAALGDFLVAEMAKYPRYEIVSLQEVNMMVGMERLKDAAGCDNVVCLSEILGALGAPYFTKGTVHLLHGQLYFNLVFVDVKHQRVVSRASVDYSDDDYFYPFVMHDLVQKLLGPADAARGASSASPPSTASHF